MQPPVSLFELLIRTSVGLSTLLLMLDFQFDLGPLLFYVIFTVAEIMVSAYRAFRHGSKRGHASSGM